MLAAARLSGRVNLPLPPSLVSPAWKPCEAQRVGIAHLLLQPRMLLADPTGVGKTPQAAIAWGVLWARLGLKALTLTRRSNLEPWAEKTKLFVPATHAAIYHEAGREETLTDSVNHVVTTYETAVADSGLLREFFRGSPPVVIFDEAQSLKGWKQGKRRPTLVELTKDSRYVWGLSATPMDGRFDELASILDVIVPGLFTSEAQFRKEFVKRVLIKLKSGRRFLLPPKKASDYRNLDALFARVAPYILRRPVEHFEGVMPTVEWRERWLAMSGEHAALYDTVLDGNVDEEQREAGLTGILPEAGERDERVLANIAAHTYAQIVCDAPAVLGFDVHPAKASELLRVLTEELHGERTLIYTRYAKVACWLMEWLKSEGVRVVGKITGDESDAARTKAREAFTTGDAGVLLITSAGGEALDLQAARAVCLYDLPWGPAELTQVVGRARRINSKHASVLVYAFGHTGTTDHDDSKRMQAKTALHLLALNANTVAAPAA